MMTGFGYLAYYMFLNVIILSYGDDFVYRYLVLIFESNVVQLEILKICRNILIIELLFQRKTAYSFISFSPTLSSST